MNEWGRRWRRMLIRFSLGGLVYRLLSLTFALLAFSLLASHRPRRLARPRTSPFHGGNAGSNPAGDANIPKDFREFAVFGHGCHRELGRLSVPRDFAPRRSASVCKGAAQRCSSSSCSSFEKA